MKFLTIAVMVFGLAGCAGIELTPQSYDPAPVYTNR